MPLKSFGAVICLAFSLCGTMVKSATYVEQIDMVIGGFAYESNFWSRINPNATVGGPSPVQTLLLSMTLRYHGPTVRTDIWPISGLELLAFSADVVPVDVPGVASASTPVTQIRAPTFDSTQGGNKVGVFSLPVSGALSFMTTDVHGFDELLYQFQLSFPGLLNDPLNLSGALVNLNFMGSPKSFDSPIYRSAFDDGQWTVSRSTSVTPGPVPLPAGVWLAGSGIGALALVSRRRRRAAGRV